MLTLKNTKHKIRIGLAACSIASLSVWSLYGLSATPNYASALTDTRTMADITYMQEINPDICQNSNLNQQYPLKDQRDEKTYNVARIKNATNSTTQCWMTQNLELINKTIGSADSDIASGSFTIPESVIAGFTSANIDARKAYVDTYGGYYNWYTATAGTGNSSITTGSVADSICPKGWRLPTGGNNAGDYYHLVSGLTAANIIADPYRYQYSGYVNSSGRLEAAGGSGNYWTSSAYDTTQAYDLRFTSSGIEMPFHYNRYLGYSIRCVNSNTRYNEPDLTPPVGENQARSNISIGIPSILTIDATSDMDEIIDQYGNANGNISATVSGNTTYDVTLSAEQTSLLHGSDTSSKIAPVAASNMQLGATLTNNTWGIYTGNSNSGNKLYAPITTAPTTYHNVETQNSNGSTTHTYDIGVKTSPSLPAGLYSTSVTVTVSAK